MEDETTARPEYVTDAHLEFLDELRESGVTNMYGASPYLVREFGLTIDDARKNLVYWMRTFGNPDH